VLSDIHVTKNGNVPVPCFRLFVADAQYCDVGEGIRLKSDGAPWFCAETIGGAATAPREPLLEGLETAEAEVLGQSDPTGQKSKSAILCTRSPGTIEIFLSTASLGKQAIAIGLMASSSDLVFSSQAQLSGTFGKICSNTVKEKLITGFSVGLFCKPCDYRTGEKLTFLLTVTNKGSNTISGLTVIDNLGAYAFGSPQTVLYPLRYCEGSACWFCNGVRQSEISVTQTAPLRIQNLQVPAEGSILILFAAEVTSAAPPQPGSSIANNAIVFSFDNRIYDESTIRLTAAEIARPVMTKWIVQNQIRGLQRAEFTFMISNYGNQTIQAEDNMQIRNVFQPPLRQICAQLDGAGLTADADYRYEEVTGIFELIAGKLAVPAASYRQKPDGSWIAAPGTVSLTVSGVVPENG